MSTSYCGLSSSRIHRQVYFDMVTMREVVREEARSRAREMSPAGLRRQCRRLQYATCRAAERAVQALPADGDSHPTEEDSLGLAAGHNIPILGDGPPLGNQEPIHVFRTSLERVVSCPRIRHRSSERGRRGRGRGIQRTTDTDAPDAIDRGIMHSRGGRGRAPALNDVALPGELGDAVCSPKLPATHYRATSWLLQILRLPRLS
jgi:hypothetical protein